MLVFKLLPNDATQVVLASLIFTIFNLLPLFYAHLLYKHRQALEQEDKIRVFGSLYDNKRIDSEKNHHAWAFPLTFFYRRTVFACITVFLFEQPSMQMMINQVISVLTIVYLSWDSTKFKNKRVRFIEIATEMILLLIGSLIQQLMIP